MATTGTTDVLMPRLSDSMAEGTIIKWLVEPGGLVVRGQDLVEIETDKATETAEAQAGGVLEVLAAVGDTVPVGAVIARLTPPAAEGPGGGDVDGPAPPATPTGEKGTAKGDVIRQELSRAQQAVARRVAEAKATIPEFTIEADLAMEHAVAFRAQLSSVGDRGAAVPTINDMVVKACGRALREFPRVNGAYRDGRFESYGRVNVGVAVAAQETMLLPTIFDADAKSLSEIAAATRLLAARARSGEITQPELSGATFTVSNLGMYGVARFTAVITPPQAAALAVGAIVGDRMTVTLTCDHRILHGVDAAQFLARIRALLESPVALLR